MMYIDLIIDLYCNSDGSTRLLPGSLHGSVGGVGGKVWLLVGKSG